MNYLEQYVLGKIKGNYFLCRCNDMIKQIEERNFGMFNGLMYSEDSVRAEYYMFKQSAIKCFASAQVAKTELLKMGVAEKDIDIYLNNFLETKIVKDDYSEYAGDALKQGAVDV